MAKPFVKRRSFSGGIKIGDLRSNSSLGQETGENKKLGLETGENDGPNISRF